MRGQLTIQANRFFAFAAVVIMAVLLLGDSSMWIVLVPGWFASWISTQIVLQHYASSAKLAGFEDDRAGILHLVEALRAAEVSDEPEGKSWRAQVSQDANSATQAGVDHPTRFNIRSRLPHRAKREG